jgi:hypothetical protein
VKNIGIFSYIYVCISFVYFRRIQKYEIDNTIALSM